MSAKTAKKTSKGDSSKSSASRDSGSSGKTSLSAKAASVGTKKGGAKAKAHSPTQSHKAGSGEEGKSHSHMKAKSSHTGHSVGKKGSLARGVFDSGETVCREVACEGLATAGGYCRLHYIKNWKKIKRKEMILREKKLNQYIEELVAKYPDKYIEAIRQDLANDKDFAKVIYDLDLDEGVDDFDVEGSDSVDSLIDTIKRDFDDEGETF